MRAGQDRDEREGGGHADADRRDLRAAARSHEQRGARRQDRPLLGRERDSEQEARGQRTAAAGGCQHGRHAERGAQQFLRVSRAERVPVHRAEHREADDCDAREPWRVAPLAHLDSEPDAQRGQHEDARQAAHAVLEQRAAVAREEIERRAQQDREPAHGGLVTESRGDIAVDQRGQRGAGIVGVVGHARRVPGHEKARRRGDSTHHGDLNAPHLPLDRHFEALC